MNFILLPKGIENNQHFNLDRDKSMSEISWDKIIFQTNLPNQEIHIWRTWLDHHNNNLKQFTILLSDNEKNAAAKFHFNRDRNRYIVRHGILRNILSQYLSIPPVEIQFSHNEFGKPILDPNIGELNFNISHSGGMAIFAFAIKLSVGVDIELIQPIKDLLRVAKTFLSSAEMETFLNLQEELQLESFFRIWTRKEALSKAIGRGFSMPLDRFDVGVNPTEGSRLKMGERDGLKQTNWQVVDLHPSPEYFGAVAYDSAEIPLCFFTYPKKQDDI